MANTAYWVKAGIALAFAAFTLIYSISFFNEGIALISRNAVFSGIVAVAVGFALLSASVTLLRDYILAAKAEKPEGRQGSRSG